LTLAAVAVAVGLIGAIAAQAPRKNRPKYSGFLPTGVSYEKVPPVPTYYYRGEKIDKQKAVQYAEGALPEEDTKLRLSIWGSNENRSKFMASLPQDVVDSVIMWSAPKGHWSALDSQKHKAFDDSGQPSIYLTTPTGRVLYHAISNGEEVVETLREHVSRWNRERPSDWSLEKIFKTMPWWAWLLILVAIWFLFFNKKKEV